MRRRLVAGALAALVVTACGDQSSASTRAPSTTAAVPVVSDLGPQSFAGPGPYAVGVRTLSLPSDNAPVEVWYPATQASAAGTPTASYDVEDLLPAALKKLFPPGFTGGVYQTDAHRGVPVAAGQFPLVAFTHGYSGFRTQSTFLTTHLASWGFVVAAPELLDNDLTAVLSGKKAGDRNADVAEVQAAISLLAQQNGAGPLAGHLDMTRVAAIGHSLGGAVSEAAAVADDRVKTFIGMAGATVGSFGEASSGPASMVPAKPSMIIEGTNDKVAEPASIAKAYAAMKQPKRYLTLQGFGHLAFADICQIGAGKGGLTGLAAGAGLKLPPNLATLATDGCAPPDAPVTTGWPVVAQAVTAQLRHVFGFDASSAGLDGLKTAYPQIVAVDTTADTAP